MVLNEARQRIAELGFDFEASEKEIVASCNLCHGRDFVIVTHHDRYGYAARGNVCARCGLVFLSPRLTEAGYASFYRHTYRPLVSAFHGRRIDAETVEQDQVVYANALAELLEPFLERGNPSSILDIGGSTGVVAERIAAGREIQAVVLDPAPDEVERARERGLEGLVGTIEAYDPGDRRFDVVLLCQTLDHVLDARGSLELIRRLIADDGVFFVDVVDFRAAYLRAWSVEAATKIDHPYCFTEATAEALLARAGFRTALKVYASDHLHIGYVCTPAAADEKALPDPAVTTEMLREIRLVQNARAPV